MEYINLRLYGEQIYPTISKYLTDYISPEIQKEDFLEKYKNGSMEIKNISLKKQLDIHPQIKIENGMIGELKMHIPNEIENFSIYLNNMECLLIISDINEEVIEKILIENKKKLINDFINYSIAKIEKKDGASFLDNIIKNFIDKIINGINIEINNLKLRIRINNKNKNNFIFIIENINYYDKKEIKIKNISVIYEEEPIKINVIDKFDFNIDITHSNEEGILNQIILKISDFKFELNENIYYEFLNYYNIFDDARYKEIYIIYKNLIQFNRPIDINGKKDYKSLWFYAIKTVIKLQKYLKYNKEYIFDLINSSQLKIIKKYINEENIDEKKFLLLDEINCLKATKEKVEKKVIENKKGNVLANAFNFFFGAKKEEKKELTEEEKEIFEEIYKDSNIINYLNGNINNNQNESLSSLIDKIKKFLSNVSINVIIDKFELILHNKKIEKKQNLFIKEMKMILNYINNEFDFKYTIKDIGYEKNKSFFNKNDKDKNAIECTRDKNNFINLSFGFENIEFNEELFLSFINLIKTKRKKKQKLFHRKNNKQIIEEKNEKENENKIIKNIQNFSFNNSFTISNIPSFSIKIKDNKIDIIIVNYSLNENSFSFTIRIQDIYGLILYNFTFNPKKEGNKFIFHPDSSLIIFLRNKTIKSLIYNYLRLNRETFKNNLDNNINNDIKDDDLLFGFNYTFYKNIDLGNLDFNNYTLDIIIKKIIISIEENEFFHSSINIDYLKILYKQKDLNVYLNKLIVKSNHTSNIILYIFGFSTYIFPEFDKENNNDNLPILNKEIEKNNNNDNNSLNISSKLNYDKLFNDILNRFNYNIDIFCFILHSYSLIIFLNIKNIYGDKIKENTLINNTFKSWNLDINYLNNINESINKRIIENNRESSISYDLKTFSTKIEMKSVFCNTYLKEIFEIWDNISFLFNQSDNPLKVYFQIDDLVLTSDKFIYSVSKMFIKNFAKDIIIKDTLYINFDEFKMCNENNIRMIYEKEIDIVYIFTSKTEDNIIIKCNNVNFQICQNDISYLLIKFTISENENDYKKFKSSDININNKNRIFKYEQIQDMNHNDNKNILKTKISMEEYQKEVNKKYSITAQINIPILKLSFCLNENYNKIAEFSIESTKIKIKSITNEDIFDKKIWRDLSYSLLLNKLKFCYFYNENKEFNILTKRQIYLNDNKNINKENKIIIENQEDQENQVEIFYDKNNGYIININQNEVNVRIDSLLNLFYYFKGALPIEELLEKIISNDSKKKNKIKRNYKGNNYLINFNKSQFQLSTSFEENENLYLDINQFIIIYDSYDGELPYGNYSFRLNKLSTNIVSNNIIRKLFFTEQNFLIIQIEYSEEIFAINVTMNILKINLSYVDLISFLKIYLLNIKMFDKSSQNEQYYLKNLEMIKKYQIENIIKNKYNKSQKDINKLKNIDIFSYLSRKNNNVVFEGEFFFEKLDITLIDNSKGSYHPFLNIINNNIYLILFPNKLRELNFSLKISSYNYISCIWEPTLEKTNIKCKYEYKDSKGNKNNSYNININDLLINLSDMSISFTLLTFNNWLKKLKEKKKQFEIKGEMISNENIKNKKEDPKTISKITNNKIINYTGIEMVIIHNNKKINCPPSKTIELEYNNDFNQSKHIILTYDNTHHFEIPLEKLITLRHIINNNLSIISENSLSEDRSIITSLYSPIMFKNKTIFPLKVIIKNNLNRNFFLDLNPNSIIGLPLYLVNNDNMFNFKLINFNKNEDNEYINDNYSNYSDNFSLKKIMNINIGIPYKEELNFINNSLTMKLDHKIRNVRTLIINTEYSIVNCLPCDIYINYSNKETKLQKCSQFYLDKNINFHFFISFGIDTNYGKFYTHPINLLTLKENNKDNSIKFMNKETHRYFNLLFNFIQNEEENILIIYAEFILYNDTETNISYSFEYKDNITCFEVSKNIHLISSKINFKEEKIKLISGNYYSQPILISSLIEASPFLSVSMQNIYKTKSLSFNIKKKFSYIKIINNPNFKENVMSIVFNILPYCVIINLLSTKKFVIFDYNYKCNQDYSMIINPLEKKDFQFFGKGPYILLGISVINLNSETYNHLIKCKFKIGKYTLSTENYTFNLEIKENPSNGSIEVYVVENNINNSHIILENLSDEGISIYQKNYEQNYIQLLFPKDTQTLKLYDYNSLEFYVQIGESIKIVKFGSMKETKIEINNRTMLLIEDNGIKIKGTFYLIEKYNNLKTTSIFKNFIININNIYISMIGDNEYSDTKLINYQRKELLLFYFSDFSLALNIRRTEGHLNKDYIKSYLKLNSFKIYNQTNNIGNFPCVFSHTTSPFIDLYNEISFYKELKIVKIEDQRIIVGNIELGIDPQFIIELFNFFDNILYRMKVTNFNVHKIFLLEKDNIQKQLIKKFNKGDILINATYLSYPKLNIEFELSKIGLNQLLRERMGCSDFYIWMANGLVEKKQNILLENSYLDFKNGGFGQYLKRIYFLYLGKIENKITIFGIKGFFGQFGKIFSFIFSKDNNNNRNKYCFINSKRLPRVFYGKFKYFKEYDKDDAILINNTFKKNKILEKYYPTRIIKGYKEFYLFTTIAMFNISKTNYYLNWNIDYFSIKSVEVDKLIIKVYYNQMIDSKISDFFQCEDEEIAKYVAECLNEEKINNKENILEL